jgi:hypothetical protein
LGESTERVNNAGIIYTVSHNRKMFNYELKAWGRNLSLPTLKNLEISRSHLVKCTRYTEFRNLKRGGGIQGNVVRVP